MGGFRLLLPDEKGIVASVNGAGVLSFVIVAEDSPIRGTEMFDLMMRAFGPMVRAIAGTWRGGFAGQRSTNIDEINRLTGAGAPLEESLSRAGTATRAARWGFTKIGLEGAIGLPGNYTKIDVIIEKPEKPP